MREERDLYLEEHPTKANGYYARDLLTLAGLLKGLRVPRVRKGQFHPKILPYRRRTSLELSEAILALYACGVSTRAISRFLEGIYGAFYSPQSISRLTQVVEEEVRAWRERPPDEEHYAVFLDGTFFSVRRGKSAKEPVAIALGIKPDGRREILGLWLFGAEGESKAIRKIFPEADWQLCLLHAVRPCTGRKRKKRPRKRCGNCGSVGEKVILALWPGGRPKLLLFLRF